MSIGDLEDYEQRVQPATSALDGFAEELISELDEQNGAFRWWVGFSDWKTLTMIADYLIQSVSGASEALLLASLAAKTHRESAEAESAAMTTVWRRLAESGETNPEAFIAAIPRDRDARKRGLVTNGSAEDCCFHLGQTLDRLAAALAIVGGFEVRDVVIADWGTIVGTPTRPGLLDELAGNAPVKRVEPSGSQGAQLQTDLLVPAANMDNYGAAEWGQWTRDTRNAMTHRSPAQKWNLVLGNVNEGIRLTRLFYRQPRWSELQSLVFAGQHAPSAGFFGAFIQRSSEDVLDGLCESMTAFVAALADTMKTCWAARKSNPSAIVQHGSQWRNVAPTEPPSQFEGYGKDLSAEIAAMWSGGQMRTSIGGGKRWTAGRAFDARRADWTK